MPPPTQALYERRKAERKRRAEARKSRERLAREQRKRRAAERAKRAAEARAKREEKKKKRAEDLEKFRRVEHGGIGAALGVGGKGVAAQARPSKGERIREGVKARGPDYDPFGITPEIREATRAMFGRALANEPLVGEGVLPENVSKRLEGTMYTLGMLSLGPRVASELSRLGGVQKATQYVPGLKGARPTRVFRYGEDAVEVPAANSVLGRTFEKAVDKARPVLSRTKLVRSEGGVYAYEKGRTLQTQSKVRTGPATALKRIGRRLSDEEQYAIRVVGEGVPIQERVAFHAAQAKEALAAGDDLSAGFHRTHAELLGRTRPLIDSSGGVPRLSGQASPRLREALEIVEEAQQARETIYRQLGHLMDDTIKRRIRAPAKAMTSQEAGRFRVPYKEGIPAATFRGKTGSNIRQLFGAGRRRPIGHGPKDPSITHTFKAALLRRGNFKINVTEAVADDLMMADRIATAGEARNALLAAADDVAHAADDVAIRVTDRTAIPAELREAFNILEALEEGAQVGAKEIGQVGESAIDDLVRYLFPGRRAVPGTGVEGFKWVPRDVAEQLAVRELKATFGPAWKAWGKVGTSFDAWNDINRWLALFLNTAYLPVQLAGQTVMGLTQQGPWLLKNLSRSARLSNKIGYRDAAVLDNAMGHGFAMSAVRHGVLNKTNDAMAGLHAAIMDLPFRRAAFFHEAAKLGYKNDGQISKLLRGGNQRDFDQIIRAAREAIVDFERLGVTERELFSRVIWFYPWIKGASRYTGRLALDHPLQAAGMSYLLYLAHLDSANRPNYMQFTIDIPGTDKSIDMRQLFTPTSAIEIGQSGLELLTGQFPEYPSIVENLTPALGGGIEAAIGYDPFRQREVPRGPQRLWESATEYIPTKRNIERILRSQEERDQEVRVYSKRGAIGRTFAGGIQPFDVNEERAEEVKTLESGEKGPSAPERALDPEHVDSWIYKRNEDVGRLAELNRLTGKSLEMPADIRAMYEVRANVRHSIETLKLELAEQKDWKQRQKRDPKARRRSVPNLNARQEAAILIDHAVKTIPRMKELEAQIREYARTKPLVLVKELNLALERDLWGRLERFRDALGADLKKLERERALAEAP